MLRRSRHGKKVRRSVPATWNAIAQQFLVRLPNECRRLQAESARWFSSVRTTDGRRQAFSVSVRESATQTHGCPGLREPPDAAEDVAWEWVTPPPAGPHGACHES